MTLQPASFLSKSLLLIGLIITCGFANAKAVATSAKKEAISTATPVNQKFYVIEKYTILQKNGQLFLTIGLFNTGTNDIKINNQAWPFSLYSHGKYVEPNFIQINTGESYSILAPQKSLNLSINLSKFHDLPTGIHEYELDYLPYTFERDFRKKVPPDDYRTIKFTWSKLSQNGKGFLLGKVKYPKF